MVPSRLHHIRRSTLRIKLSLEVSSHHPIFLSGFIPSDTSIKLCYGSMNIFLLRIVFFFRCYTTICFYKTTTCSYDQNSSFNSSKILIIEQIVLKITGRDVERKKRQNISDLLNLSFYFYLWFAS